MWDIFSDKPRDVDNVEPFAITIEGAVVSNIKIYIANVINAMVQWLASLPTDRDVPGLYPRYSNINNR